MLSFHQSSADRFAATPPCCSLHVPLARRGCCSCALLQPHRAAPWRSSMPSPSRPVWAQRKTHATSAQRAAPAALQVMESYEVELEGKTYQVKSVSGPDIKIYTILLICKLFCLWRVEGRRGKVGHMHAWSPHELSRKMLSGKGRLCLAGACS